MSGCCGQKSLSSPARFIQRKDWPEMWVRSAAPGDLLLLSDSVGSCGGVLRLPIQDMFIALNADQVWHRHPVPWPVKEDKIATFRIVGNKIEYTMK